MELEKRIADLEVQVQNQQEKNKIQKFTILLNSITILIIALSLLLE